MSKTQDLTLRILEEARRILSVRKHWTKGCFARDKQGNATDATSPKAVCFCPIGSLFRAHFNLGFKDSDTDAKVALAELVYGGSYLNGGPYLSIHSILRDALPDPTYTTIAQYNDAPKRRHSQILKLFDQAIANRKRQLKEVSFDGKDREMRLAGSVLQAEEEEVDDLQMSHLY